MLNTADVVVIGGGSTGTSIAWQLARQGAGRIVLLEKAAIAAGGTGWSSALIRQHYTHEALTTMALYSLRVFKQFQDVVGGDSGFRQTGFLVLVKAEDEAALVANVAMQQGVGVNTQVLTPTELSDLEPRITRDDVGVAAWEPESGYADPVTTTAGFADAARRNGADLRIGVTATRIVASPTGVTGVDTSAGFIATRTVIGAAGFRTLDLIAPLGIDLALTPVRHDIAIIRRTPDFGPPHPTISDRINGSYFRPEGQDLTLIGTTAPFDGHEDPDVENDRAPYPEDLETLAARFWQRFPSQDEAEFHHGYTGVYDCSPDLQPMVGPLPKVPGLYVAMGFSGHGFKLSPAIGHMVAEQIVAGRSSLVDIDLFRPSRFAESRPIVSHHAYSVATLG